MCRLFFQIGKNVSSSVYQDYLDTCSDYVGEMKKDVHEHNENKLFNHVDGYGYSFMHNDHYEVRRFNESISERPPIPEWEKIQSPILLAHARRASPNMAVKLSNNHPFYWYNGDEYVFAHHGTITSQINNYCKEKFYLRGTTDSEKYFYSLLTSLRENDWTMKKSLVESIMGEWDYTGANFILASREKAWVGSYHRKNPLYYTMKLYETLDSIIISSSKLESLGKPTELLTDGTLIEINLKKKVVLLFRLIIGR